MNLSKSEKLLAAKKKLREFQLNKMMQDGSAKQKHNSVEALGSQEQNVDTGKLEPEIVHNLSVVETYENNSYVSGQNIQANDALPTNSITKSEQLINHEDLNYTIQDENKPLQQIEETNARPDAEKKVELSELPKVQKEHLLEMASAVADVLTNDSEQMETYVDSDLLCRNQFLSSYLEEQKKVVNELHIELSKSHSRVLELEAKLETTETDFQAQLAREINPLKEQLKVHTQTTGILIAEKAELTAALRQAQQSAKESSEEVEEITNKYKNAHFRIIECEKEISAFKSNNEDLRKNFNQLQTEHTSLEQKFFELKKQKEDLYLETSELKQKLNLKKTELIAVQQELDEKAALLSLSELRIQQMKGTIPTEDEKHASTVLKQELAQTKESLKAANNEMDEVCKRYQNYVKQLDMQRAKLLDETKVQKTVIEDLQAREQSYIQRLSELEQKLQQEQEKVENLLPLQNCKDQVDNLLKNVDDLTLEQERLHITLSEKDSQIEMLMKDLNDLRETNNQEEEVTKLASALESEQLGASRAIHQNRQLKEQLTDMENAFVSLSNAKLDLTEQLQAERTIGRKLNVQLNNVEAEMEQLKEKLKEKEALLQELEKESLQNAQLADQVQHYQAQSYNVNTFQQELQHALVTIQKLEKEKQELLHKLKEGGQENSLSETDSCETSIKTVSIQEEENENLEKSHDTVSEPIKKLEQRFKETMERVAELTEEKQKLEHLVLQLQSETETIGDYITLYQKQRAVLQSRAKEREQIFRQLLEQRNQQLEQLHKLKVLVSEFIKKEYIHSNGTDCTDPEETHSDDCMMAKIKTEKNELHTENKSVSELLDVLTEIKDCKDSCIFEPNFHPCPWCSGKLLTV